MPLLFSTQPIPSVPRTLRGAREVCQCLAVRWLVLFSVSVQPLVSVDDGKWIQAVATAYSPHDPIDGAYHATKGDRWRWITADGRTDVRKHPYGIAVPLKSGTRRPSLPFGTYIFIPADTGYVAKSGPTDRIFKVDDVGNGRQYRRTEGGLLHIDLRFKTHASAIQWAGPTGRRVIWVYVYDP